MFPPFGQLLAGNLKHLALTDDGVTQIVERLDGLHTDAEPDRDAAQGIITLNGIKTWRRGGGERLCNGGRIGRH